MTAPEKAVYQSALASLRALSRTSFVIRYLDARTMRMMFDLLDTMTEVFSKHG